MYAGCCVGSKWPQDQVELTITIEKNIHILIEWKVEWHFYNYINF